MEDTNIMDDSSEVKSEVTILDVLGVDLCRYMILNYLHIRDIVRSERVCRRWQRAVLDYLLYCRNLTVAVSLHHRPRLYKSSHRVLLIHDDGTFPIRNVFEKFGPFIKTLLTDQNDEEFYQHVTSCCPRLRQIELKYLSMSDANTTEQKIGRAFQNLQLETIKFVSCDDVSGKCLSLMNLSKLKSLCLIFCKSFRPQHLGSNVSSLRNVRNLELISIYNFSDMLTLLENMPKLESLTYNGCFDMCKLVEHCSRLDHLKSIYLEQSSCNSEYDGFEFDDFLEGLASSCKKLEYLNLPGIITTPYWRGLTALVLRPSSGTSICFTSVRSVQEDERRLLEFLQPLNKKLEACGRNKITQEVLNQAFQLKGVDDLLELKVVHPAPGNAKYYPELKVVLHIFFNRISFDPYYPVPPYL